MKINLFRQGDWRRLLVDILVVLIGVLAALVLNNVREDAVADRAARVAKARLMQEVEQNAEELRDAREVVERRLSLLGELRGQLPAGKSMKDLVEQFRGFWVVELNASSWEYLSRSALADSVDPDLLQETFALYKFNRQFDQLNGQIADFVYSETFVLPDRAATALDISEAIMWQQLRWLDLLLPQYQQFLSRYAEGGREGDRRVALSQ
ncbi:hypothetical protein [Microbulbifer magnicolonia]|uniref:hypothetical protein n=1 Tax=Microbulbifer magnicolonia TaxID=3109744 RepID=UPI002B4082D3|nr:hypothetical protein [Microbulbifer sp. GG15]